MRLSDLIIPLGITTYIMVAITLISGLLRIKLARHKILGYITIILATLHAGLVLYLYYFR